MLSITRTNRGWAVERRPAHDPYRYVRDRELIDLIDALDRALDIASGNGALTPQQSTFLCDVLGEAAHELRELREPADGGRGMSSGRARPEQQLQRAVLGHLAWRAMPGVWACHYPGARPARQSPLPSSSTPRWSDWSNGGCSGPIARARRRHAGGRKKRNEAPSADN